MGLSKYKKVILSWSVSSVEERKQYTDLKFFVDGVQALRMTAIAMNNILFIKQ
tara:strand:- start:367 stop:525 length:159 start_codon:yes stop_codon:yes gene_type:complete